MPPLPEHYARFYRTFIKLALVMLVFGGFAGVLFQELTVGMRFADVPPGYHLESVYHLALLHGHSFLIGAIMPITWIVVLQIGLFLQTPPLSPKSLAWITWTYIPGVVSVLSLITYKGLHYVARVKAGERDFDAIHGSLFGGIRWLRGVVYGSSHTVATIGLVIFAWLVWRQLGRRGGSNG